MKYLIAFMLLCLSILGLSQTITVVIKNNPKTVPVGKKWTLLTNKETKIEVNNGTLVSGNLCNALIMSNPRILQGIVEGDYGKPNKVYGILFKKLTKVEYANDLTFTIIPLTITDSELKLNDLQDKKIEEVGSNRLVFHQGQKLYVGQCLVSIQLLEENLNETELANLKKEEELKKKQHEERGKIIGNGTATGSGGGSFLELPGWTWELKPKPRNDSNENGRIVFEIIVNKIGGIDSVRTLEKSVSPTLELINKSEVKQLKFLPLKSNTEVPSLSIGRITFIIRSK